MSIGGSLFVHNAVEFDYCIREAIESLVPFCDDIVVLDAQSTDDTISVLRNMEMKHTQVRVIEGAEWECADDKARLPKLANLAKSYLKTDWHFMLQADEVIHETSIPAIMEFARSGDYDSCTVSRLNLWGEFDTMIRPGSSYQPCSWQIVRYGKPYLEAYGDAESLNQGMKHIELIKSIILFHYGFLRNNMVGKVISMQSWFWGKGAQPDQRYVNMRGNGGVFDPYSITPREELIPIPISHPAVMEYWISERMGRAVLT